jgi:ribosomal protein L25 (general stress protein Ctc)
MIQTFNEYYCSIETGHKLQYPLEGSCCDLDAYFESNKYTFHVSVVQAIYLLHLSKCENYQTTFEELKKIMKLSDSEINKNLIPLVIGKGDKQVLIKEPEAKKFKDDDLIRINLKFKSKSKKVKINQFQRKETKEEIEMTNEKVLRERKHAIEALIVRLMKGEKTMNHNVLIHKVLEIMKLPLNVKGNLIFREETSKNVLRN